MTFRSYIRYPKTAQPQSMTPRQVAGAYNFPMDKATGKGYIGGIIELGGGFNLKQVEQYFTSQGLPVPGFVAVDVDGGTNSPDGPDGADGEVSLDMLVAGAVAPNVYFRIYFAPNTDSGFLDALKQAASECDGISISWGAAESEWSAATMDEFASVIQRANDRGCPVFVAAGDSGSKDSTSSNQTDFPASAPSAVGCGGTRLALDSRGDRAAETVWDDNPTSSATGGGVSKHFPGRDVPDVAGNADPDSGYEIVVDGQSMVVGGTSAVAPLMLGLHALLWELNGGNPFDFMNLVTANPTAMFDVTIGDNGGFRAGPGRDETTGFGVPDGGKLASALIGPPPPPPPSDPLADFPVTQFDALVKAKHNYNHAESAAVTAIEAWATEHGLVLG